jgi:hypothetical protein
MALERPKHAAQPLPDEGGPGDGSTSLFADQAKPVNAVWYPQARPSSQAFRVATLGRDAMAFNKARRKPRRKDV